MSKFKRVCSLLLCALMIVSIIPAVAVGAETDTEYTLSAVTTQLRRMWCQQKYNSSDYVYEDGSLHWGRVLYTRFVDSSNTPAKDIKQVTLRFDALARSSEKTVYAAAIAITDEHALYAAETDVTAATAKLRYSGTRTAANKLMTDSSGYYLPVVSGSVVAYTKATGADTAVTEGAYTISASNTVFEYPVTVELDVTETVKAAKANGQNVQFVIVMAKDVFVNETVNLGKLETFGEYKNKTVYDTEGNVLYSNVSASLDTNGPVCGSDGYYQPDTKVEDDYFYWCYPAQNSFKLFVQKYSPEDLFAQFKTKATSLAAFVENLPELKDLLAESWEQYEEMHSDENLDEVLFAKLALCETFEQFYDMFTVTVGESYWQGYNLHLKVERSFGGRKGNLTLVGQDAGELSFVKLVALGQDNQNIYEEIITLRQGAAQYNIYEKAKNAAFVTLQACADEEGKTFISGFRKFDVGAVALPSVFITELSNQHTRTYYPDEGKQNSGTNEQTFQYIELYNYSDQSVDLSEHRFVYIDDIGTHTFDWILEQNGSLILNPGEIYLIGVYSADTAAKGYTYANSDAISEYWNAFNSFYNCNISLTNRAMIACVASGDGETMLDGIDHLERSHDAGVEVIAQIRKGETVVTEVSLAETRPSTSFSFQFMPSDTEQTQEEFLFVTGCFPGKLLSEQDLGYCEQTFLAGTEMLKVMSYNILATEKTASDNYTNLTIEQREDLLVQVVQQYDLDIIGLQEVNYRWAPLLQQDMPGLGYGVVQGISTKNHTYSNCSGTWDLLNPIYYRLDKFDLLESGGAFLTPDGKMETQQWDSVNMKRTVTWAVLKNKKNGEVVSFLNTHLILSGKVGRVEQVKMMYTKGAELQQKYGGGIVITGDHNMVEGSEPYQAYINGGVVVDSRYQTSNHTCISSCSNGGVAHDETYGVPIDYVFVSPSYVVNKYYVHNGVVENGHLSDHAGVYAELYTRSAEDTDMPQILGVEDGKTYCDSVTLTIKENYIRSVTLNGQTVEHPELFEIKQTGEYTVEAVDMAGRKVSAQFTLTKHDYPEDTWQITTPATCSTKGLRSNVCKNCGNELTVDIPATQNHTPRDEGELISPATCKNYGKVSHFCTVCQQTYVALLPKNNDHIWNGEFSVDVAPTCVDVGSQSIHCSVCDAKKEGSITEIPATNKHTGGTATCKAKALCTVCSQSYGELGSHSAGPWETTVSATTTKEGRKEKHCTLCGELTDSAVIPKLSGVNTLSIFKDLKKSDWFVKNGAIDYAYNNGFFKGITKTTFEPNTAVTRGMFVTVLGRLHGVKEIKAATQFGDVKKSDYFSGFVAWAAKNGIVTGTSKTTFAPNASVTREQICAMMYRYCDYAKIKLQKVNVPISFKDAKQIASYARSSVTACQTGGIVSGKGGGKFDPKGNATRAEVATILMNFCKNYVK